MKMYQSEKWLRKQYVRQRKTAKEIAKEQGVTEKTIWKYLSKYNLIREQRRLK